MLSPYQPPEAVTEPSKGDAFCRPVSFFKWDFIVDGPGYLANLNFNWFTESGHVLINGTRYHVQKQAMFAGHWLLLLEGKQSATAQKSNAIQRKIEIEDAGGRYLLRADSAFRRVFCLEHEGSLAASFTPNHPLTRRARIAIHDERLKTPTVLFAFWLVVLMWRRASNGS